MPPIGTKVARSQRVYQAHAGRRSPVLEQRVCRPQLLEDSSSSILTRSLVYIPCAHPTIGYASLNGAEGRRRSGAGREEEEGEGEGGVCSESSVCVVSVRRQRHRWGLPPNTPPLRLPLLRNRHTHTHTVGYMVLQFDDLVVTRTDTPKDKPADKDALGFGTWPPIPHTTSPCPAPPAPPRPIMLPQHPHVNLRRPLSGKDHTVTPPHAARVGVGAVVWLACDVPATPPVPLTPGLPSLSLRPILAIRTIPGQVFTDHMLTAKWTVDGGWGAPHIHPVENLSLHPVQMTSTFILTHITSRASTTNRYRSAVSRGPIYTTSCCSMPRADRRTFALCPNWGFRPLPASTTGCSASRA